MKSLRSWRNAQLIDYEDVSIIVNFTGFYNKTLLPRDLHIIGKFYKHLLDTT